MKKKITLCSSASFFEKLWVIKDAIEKRGYEVLLPSMENFNRRGEQGFAKIQHDLIREHFRKIDKAHAIYVANFDKNGIEGYIGGNTFLEMGKAFDRGIPIFLMYPVPEISYRDELIALQPVIIGNNFETLDHILRSTLS